MTLVATQPDSHLKNFETSEAAPAPLIKVRKKRAPKHDFKDGKGRIWAHKHDNGGGWVANTATVHPGVYVGPRCQIFDYATVTDHVRLEGRAKISGNARVSDTVRLSNAAWIYGAATVRNSTHVADGVRVCGNAEITGTSRLANTAIVYESARVVSGTLTGACRISGLALLVRVHVSGAAEINGNAIVTDGAVRGQARIRGFSQILGSTVINNYSNSEHWVDISDHVVLCHGTRINSPVQISDHVTLSRSSITIYIRGEQQVPALRGDVAIINRAFNDYDTLVNSFRAALTAGANNRVIQREPVSVGSMPPQPLGPQRPNYLAAMSGQNTRRVMTLETDTP